MKGSLSPEEYLWPQEKFEKYSEEDMMHDLFEIGYVDVGIFQPTYLKDFYVDGFNTTEQDAVLKEKYPDSSSSTARSIHALASRAWSILRNWLTVTTSRG